MKKGFTLVEFLGVIILLAIITLLVLPNIVGSVKGSKDKVDNTTLEMIYSASDLYVSNHPDYFPKDNRNKFIIELTDLITDKLLEGPIKLFDGTDITDKKCVQVIYQDEYKYELKNAGECEAYIWEPEPVYLQPGHVFNSYIKTLANNTSVSYSASDTTIKSVSFHSNGKLPTGYTKESLEALRSVDVSVSNDGSIKAYYDGNGNIYVYSEGLITANEDSSWMFQRLKGLTNLDLSNFNTSNVTGMYNMFADCISLTTLDLSKFDTSKSTNMEGMFYNCSGLTTLDLSSFTTTNVTSTKLMFAYCSSLTTIDLSSFNTSNVTDMSYVFFGTGLTALDLSSFNTSSVTNMEGMFHSSSSLTALDLSKFDTSKSTNMARMFQGCSSLTTLNLSNFNTSNVTNMSWMFNKCSSLTTLDLSSFNTEKVTTMEGMFGSDGAMNLTSINGLDGFNTSNVTTMARMFQGCSSLTTLNLSNFNTSNVTNMSYMFSNCISLTVTSISSLDNWNIDRATNFIAMLSGVSKTVRPTWNGTWDGSGTFTKAS